MMSVIVRLPKPSLTGAVPEAPAVVIDSTLSSVTSSSVKAPSLLVKMSVTSVSWASSSASVSICSLSKRLPEESGRV